VTKSNPRARWAWDRPLAMLLAAACLILLAIGATAGAAPARHARPSTARPSAHTRPSRAIATAARTLPPSLRAAAKRSIEADRTLVSRAKALKRCLRENGGRPRRCDAARRAVQRAGSRLASMERRLSRIARTTGRTGHATRASARQAPPQLTVSGQTLSWTRTAHIDTYVLVRKVPGQANQYSVLRGTSTTPPPVPGVTVRYTVRTTVDGSAWADEQSIAYPPATEIADTQAAPAISVSGQSLTWTPIADVDTYVLATKAPGKAAQYTVLSGTSVTPPRVAGVTVHYSIRTAVDGSAWAPEVAISYRATAPSAPPAAPATPPAGSGSGGPFEVGAVVGSAQLYELPWLEQLGAHTARMEFEINTPVSQLEPVIEAYAKAGIRPLLLAGFDGRLPSTAEAQNLASWAATFGPGGAFWQGKSYPANTAVTDIEFGNETSYSYQFSETSSASNWYDLPSYAARAQSYALRFKDAETAIQAVNPSVGLLAQADDGGSGTVTWVQNMFAAVPDLAQRVAGWTVHPYGPEWESTINRLISSTQAAGAPSSIPLYVTEWGLSSDDGRCLSENFGFNKCMSYSEAASTLESNVAAMHARYGGRLRSLYIFQARDQQPTGASTEREGYCGALQSNQAPKGAYTTAVESLLSANP
jgi:hypothetical protein